jgi:hypothetical protein
LDNLGGKWRLLPKKAPCAFRKNQFSLASEKKIFFGNEVILQERKKERKKEKNVFLSWFQTIQNRVSVCFSNHLHPISNHAIAQSSLHMFFFVFSLQHAKTGKRPAIL